MRNSKPLANIRKSSKALGDDVTLTRFIAINPGVIAKPRPPLSADSPIVIEARTKFERARIHPAAANVLSSGHNSVKIGRDVRKGPLRGYWIYSVSLEERATCPTTCAHWLDCYGNNMPFAQRTQHGPALLDKLRQEIPTLLGVRGRKGILIRLHGLGDFYSVKYVEFWREMLRLYPKLSIFGYTARHEGPIGQAIAFAKVEFGKRFSIRYSDRHGSRHNTVSIRSPDECPPYAFICPEQTGDTRACATCAACWSTDKTVAFIGH